MKVHTYEEAFLTVGVLVLLACASALIYASFGLGMHLPTRAGHLNPQRAYSTPPFDHPGVHQTGPGRYEVVLIAQAWAFLPNEIRVPANATVTFIATSGDIIHGFDVAGTRRDIALDWCNRCAVRISTRHPIAVHIARRAKSEINRPLTTLSND